MTYFDSPAVQYTIQTPQNLTQNTFSLKINIVMADN